MNDQFTSTRTLTLWIHSDAGTSTGTGEVILNANSFPEAGEGEYVELLKATDELTQGSVQSSALIFKVEPFPKDYLRKQNQLQISVTQAMAHRFNLSNRNQVFVTVVPRPIPQHQFATTIEVFFSASYLSRADMMRFSLSLIDMAVWTGQRLPLPGLHYKLRIGDIWTHGKKRQSAIISERTKIIYRSQSAEIIIFLQIAAEGWTFDVDGSLFYEKAIGSFLPELFSRWYRQNTSHSVTIVLVSRVIYDEEDISFPQAEIFNTDVENRKCRDFYNVIIDAQINPYWPSVLRKLKEQFFKFQKSVLLDFKPRTDGKLVGRISNAHDGPVLESINLAVNRFDAHHIDRDLQRSGATLIFITPGTCHFYVDKLLLRLTTERMRKLGTVFDCVSLGKAPLHQVPVFRFSCCHGKFRRN